MDEAYPGVEIACYYEKGASWRNETLFSPGISCIHAVNLINRPLRNSTIYDVPLRASILE